MIMQLERQGQGEKKKKKKKKKKGRSMDGWKRLRWQRNQRWTE